MNYDAKAIHAAIGNLIADPTTVTDGDLATLEPLGLRDSALAARAVAKSMTRPTPKTDHASWKWTAHTVAINARVVAVVTGMVAELRDEVRSLHDQNTALRDRLNAAESRVLELEARDAVGDEVP
jgi:hypothetical protein